MFSNPTCMKVMAEILFSFGQSTKQQISLVIHCLHLHVCYFMRNFLCTLLILTHRKFTTFNKHVISWWPLNTTNHSLITSPTLGENDIDKDIKPQATSHQLLTTPQPSMSCWRHSSYCTVTKIVNQTFLKPSMVAKVTTLVWLKDTQFVG